MGSKLRPGSSYDISEGIPLAEFRRGICWFCQGSCNPSTYTHEECILDYFGKTRRDQALKK